MPDSTLYRTLTYAGSIPFVACALLPYLGITTLGPLGAWYEVMILYGLAIASFLAGTHWAFELVRPGAYPVSLFVISNVIVLATWFGSLLGPVSFALAVQCAAFITLLVVDGVVAARGGITAEYWHLRQRITAIVLAALVLGILEPWLA